MVEPSRAKASDAELARQISDEPRLSLDAEQELCGRFVRRIRSYGLRHLGSRSEADDLVQRVLLLVVGKLRAGQVREPERIASFVLGTARLVAKAMQRGQARDEVSIDAAQELAEPSVQASEPLERERLIDCLQALDERERSVVLRSFFEGADAREIGHSLRVEQGHVRVIRHRALSRLRACLEGEAEGAS